MEIDFIISYENNYSSYFKLLRHVSSGCFIEDWFKKYSLAIDYIKTRYPNNKFNLWKDVSGELYSMNSKRRDDNIPLLYINGIIEPLVLSEN